MARYADGYAHNGGPPRAFARAAASALAAWSDLDRPGRPLLWGQGYFALGDERGARRTCATTTPSPAPSRRRSPPATSPPPRAIRDFVRGYEEAGCDELILFPTVADLDQLDRLAEVLA